MKILSVVFGLGKGGTERAAQVFSQAYAELGHDSVLLYFEEAGPRAEALRRAGIMLHEGLSPAVCASIAAWQPDLVHLHSHRLKLQDVQTIVSLCSADCRVIETNVFSTPSPWQEDLHLSLQLSEWCQWLYTLRGGSAPCAIVPNPVQTSRFHRVPPSAIAAFRRSHEIPDGAPIVGRIGQAYEGKWSAGYLSVFSHLLAKHPSAVLMVVGAPEALRQKLSQLDHANRLRIVDRILGDENLRIAYSAFDAFMHLAEQGESFGFAPVEALLCETPVISKCTPWADNSQAEILSGIEGTWLVADDSTAASRLLWLLDRQGQSPRIVVDRESLCKRFDHHNVAKRALLLATSHTHLETVTSNQQLPRILNIANQSTPPPSVLSKLLLCCNSSSALKRLRFSADRDWWRRQPPIQRLRSLTGILATILRNPACLGNWIQARQPTRQKPKAR